MRHLFKRPIGKILLDGKFLNPDDLQSALQEQQQTRELLGQVLLKMGVLTACDVAIPLHLQKHLNHLEDAVKVAAGQRRLLGALLVESGQITAAQLDEAIAQQQRTGEKLGEVFVRLGLLTRRQLTALLDFQENQAKRTDSPLRLGELLIGTGHITRDQLTAALGKQSQTGKRLGHVLVEEGYVRPRDIKQGMRLQKRLIGAVLAAVLSLGLSSIASARSVDLQWDPNTNADQAGYKVYYVADTASFADAVPIDVQNLTSTTVTGLDPAKSYTFAVTSYDSAGDESPFSDVVYVTAVTDTTAPTVAVASPTNSATVSGTVVFSLSASDNVGISKLEYYVNGVLTATDSSGTLPYAFGWDTSGLAAGSYTLTAKAYDAAGNVGQASAVTVNVAKDAIPPTVLLSAPANNAVVSGAVNLSAGASDNIGVSKVEIYINGALYFAGNAAPSSFTWDTTSAANGAYTIVAKAYDAAGNVGVSSSSVVTVNNVAADTIAPTVAIISPANAATVSGAVVITLTPADNVGVTKLEYYVNGARIATDTSGVAPYAISWNTSNLTPGAYTLTAKAYDAAGNVTQSSAVTVTVIAPDATAPILSTFTMPKTATALTVAVTAFTASDNVRVTGYLITESATKPAASAAGWSAAAPAGFTFSGIGAKTAYAWVKDAAGNVSASKTASVTIAGDTTVPTVKTFTIPATATTLTIPVSSFTASDNVGVTAYLITESATKPTASATGWSAAAPTSYTFSAKGAKIAYSWARDAAGNISAYKAAKVTIK